MDDRHKALLRFNHVRLIEDMIDVSGVCDRLLQTSVVTWCMLDELNEIHMRSNKIRTLLGILPRRGQNAFDCFVAALKETHNDHLAELLDPVTEKQPDDTNSENADLDEIDAGPGCCETEDSLPASWPPKLFDPNDVHVKVCNMVDPETIQLICDKENVYRMLASPRGQAIIINNINFDSDERPTRKGAYQDSISVDLLLNQLDFKVKHFVDLDYMDSVSLFEEESKYDHSKSDCFILVYMSYGDESFVYTLDGKTLEIAKIMTYFDGKHCPSLLGKPKLFFFLNGYQGTIDRGIYMEEGDTSEQNISFPSKPLPSISKPTLETRQTADIRITEVNKSPKHCPIVTTLPSKADMFCGFATVPGYTTFRKPNFGAWYLQGIVHVFQRHAHKDELTRLMRKVNSLVASGDAIVPNCNYIVKQMPMYQSTLRKDLYFFPGINVNNLHHKNRDL